MKKNIIFGWVVIIAAALWLSTGCATSRQASSELQAGASDPNTPEIKWGYSLPDGLKIASETKKPVMVVFYAPWCATCKLMDQRIYSREDLVKTSWALVPVKIDVDEKPGVASRYGVDALPAVIFLNSEGKEISRISGLMPAEGLIQRMEQSITSEASSF